MELYHHGILGQKWGKKNGPPYPLDAEDHSASEKKAGYKASIKKKAKEITGKAKEAWNDPRKRRKIIEAGKVAAVTTLAAIGTYALVKNELEYTHVPVTKYTMPQYGAKGKMIMPPMAYTDHVTIPRYVQRGHNSVGNLMNKVGKGFDISKLTIDELKQLDLY